MAIKRALSLSEIRAFKPETLPFADEWLASLGCPELTGSWIIYGLSANGKTRFALQLARYLATFCKVAYNSLEEGLSKSLQAAILDIGMENVKRNFMLLDKEPISELRERLRRKNSPKVIFIDSLQYTGMSYTDYRELRDEFRNKLFIFISHADGREPKGNVAKSIKFDANIKIPIQGYKATPQSRYGGGADYIIWQKGYDEVWGY